MRFERIVHSLCAVGYGVLEAFDFLILFVALWGFARCNGQGPY